jgi:DUF438 domain-containing protein
VEEKENRKEILRDIILKLHQGLSVEDAKKRFENEIGRISSTEIAEIEQSLIDDGVSTDEVKKFCNVHALLFQSALGEAAIKEESAAHPMYLFKLENREIEKITNDVKKLINQKDDYNFVELKKGVKNLLTKLEGIKIHYTRKEQILFPYLEKYGFFGPSKVMWGKHDDIRKLLVNSANGIDNVTTQTEFDEYVEKNLNLLIEEVQGMIFKEENILFPTALEKLNTDDWVEVLKESEEVGYVYIEKPKETEELIRELRAAVIIEPLITDKGLTFPSGELNVMETMLLLNTLPVDITFVDKDDRVKYFSEGKDRIFLRSRSIIGRKVQNCHPPESVDVVEQILKSFKEGSKNYFEFWINLQNKFVHIRYFAVRDNNRIYQGTLEVTQDVSRIRSLTGEKRILDERA